MAQEFYPQYDQENEYYYDQERYYPYKNNNNDNYKNGPIVNVEKKLFVCNNATQNPIDFFCSATDPEFFIPAAIDSGKYIPCNEEICPFIDESDFGVQIFKDVATVRELSPEGKTVNLDKLHYTVTESDISDPISRDECAAVGFSHFNSLLKLTEDNVVFYDLCVNYVGECEGMIYPGEEKDMSPIENYIFSAFPIPLPTDGNTVGAAQSSSLSQQSNNQALQSLLNIRSR